MKKILTLFLLAVLAACEKDPGMYDNKASGDGYSLSHGEIVLGKRLDNPYTVANMEKALGALYPVKAGQRIQLNATDVYVRFLPASDAELSLLESLCPILSDHPFDYEILRDGDYYHDPQVPEGEITWQYAVLPSSILIPSDIRHEVIDSCYISSETESTKADGIDWAAVERESFHLTGNDNMLLPETKAGDNEAARPCGRISIIDDACADGEESGVKGVKVCVNSFVKFATAYTDDDGCYKINKKFTSDVRYRLIFENTKGFSIGVNLLLVNASTSALGKYPPSGLDVSIDKSADRRLFSRCVVNNAAYDYWNHCKEQDVSISTPPANLRIWIFQNLKDSLSPMLQQGVGIDSGKLSDFLGEYKTLVKMFLPDMLLGLKGCSDYASIYAAATHGLAEGSHFVKVGKVYWSSLLAYELTSFCSSFRSLFGAGTEDDSGYCEVSEMWSFYVENIVNKSKYGIDTETVGTSHWFSPQILMYLDERGVNENKIFNALDPDVHSKEAFRESLENKYPEHRSLIEQAFELYQ